jgi:D-alanyl-D-alanine carboxypeptidase
MKIKTINKKTRLLIFQITLSTAVAYLLIAGGIEFNKTKNQTSAVLTASAATSSIPFPISETREIAPFTFLDLEAKSVIVYDISEGKILYSKQKDDILPIASITKLMTVFAASRSLSPESTATIGQEDLDLDSSSSNLYLGEHWDFKNLTALTLVSSSNSGANAIAREAEKISQKNFVTQMNELAKEIGLQNTSFRNPTGLDLQKGKVSGSYSTVHDIARLYSYIYRNNLELLNGTNKSYLTVSSLDDLKHGVTNTNEIINKIPNVVSSKTGTTPLAGGNLAVIFEPVLNHPVAIVTLGGTASGRFGDMMKLVKDTMAVIKE